MSNNLEELITHLTNKTIINLNYEEAMRAVIHARGDKTTKTILHSQMKTAVKTSQQYVLLKYN